MPWTFLDDGFAFHPKVMKAGNAAPAPAAADQEDDSEQENAA